MRGEGGVANVLQGAGEEFVLQAWLLCFEHRQHRADGNGLAVIAAVLPTEDARTHFAVAADYAQPIVMHLPGFASGTNRSKQTHS